MKIVNRIKGFCGGSEILSWLILLNVGVSLLLWIITSASQLFHADTGWTYRWFALSSNLLTFLTHPWTIGTYMVSQFGILHTLFNVLWLYWFGRMLLDVRPDRALLQLYVGGGLAGAIFYLVSAALTHYSGGYLTGASAAVLAVMTATTIITPNRNVMLWLLGEVKLKWVAIGCILLTLWGAGGPGAPAQIAHGGGIAFGLAWALGIRRLKLPAKRSRPKIRARQTVQTMKNSSHRPPEPPTDSERLDQLLDKIRESGYESLSPAEKSDLNAISSRLKK